MSDIEKVLNVLALSEKYDLDCSLKPADCTRLMNFIDALQTRIDDLETQRWIPVSERLPETYKPVLTVDMSEATQIPVPAFYNPDTKCWSTHFEYDLWVTHWMQLPEPPNDTQKETGA